MWSTYISPLLGHLYQYLPSLFFWWCSDCSRKCLVFITSTVTSCTITSLLLTVRVRPLVRSKKWFWTERVSSVPAVTSGYLMCRHVKVYQLTRSLNWISSLFRPVKVLLYSNLPYLLISLLLMDPVVSLPWYSAEYTDGGFVVHRDASVIVSRALAGDETPLDLSTSSKSSSDISPSTPLTSVPKPVEDKKKRKRPDRKMSKKIEEKKRQRMKPPKRAKRLKGEATFDHSQVPSDILLCPICKDLMVDATVTPCCAHSYCDSCVRTHLLNSENICFICNKSLSLDDLVPYYVLRWIIKSRKKLHNV